MKNKKLGVIALFVLSLMVMSSCVKEEKTTGCLDVTAVNYEPESDIDGGCEYDNRTQSVWNNGVSGVWGTDPIAFFPCAGSADEVEVPIEPGSTTMQTALALKTDSEGNFFGFFITSNNHDARFYSNPDSKLNFVAKKPVSGSNATVDLFIRGTQVETHYECTNYPLSDRQTIYTADLNEETMTPLSFTLSDFTNLNLNNVGVIAGFEFTGAPNETILLINNVTWTNF